MAVSLERKKSRFIDKMTDDARPITSALDRRVHRKQWDVRVVVAVREFATVVANIQRPETDQPLFGIAVNPNLAISKLHSLRDVVQQQPTNVGVGERPAQDSLKLVASNPQWEPE